MYGIKVWSSEKDNDWYLLKDMNDGVIHVWDKKEEVEQAHREGISFLDGARRARSEGTDRRGLLQQDEKSVSDHQEECGWDAGRAVPRRII